jgi:23S rRNA (uracil1939-C5)-methyltransferase
MVSPINVFPRTVATMPDDADHKKQKFVYKSPGSKPVRRQEEPVPKVCKIQEICGTCRFINEPYHDQLTKKWQQGVELLRTAGVLTGTHVLPPKDSVRPLGYRTHAKLAVRHRDEAVHAEAAEGRFVLGLYQPGSHRIVDVSRCPLHKDTINILVRDLTVELEDTTLEPYNEEAGTGDLRYVAIRTSHVTDEVMITFVVTKEEHKATLKGLVMRLKAKGHQIQSAHMNLNDQNTNVIFGESSRHLVGADRLREGLVDLSFEIGPTSFFQVNPWEAERIYRRLEQLAGGHNQQDVAWDLYCGVGQISMVLARCGYRVLGIEMNPQAIRDAQRNANRNLELPPTFIAGKVEDQLAAIPQWAAAPKLIITNPARKGLDAAARQALVQVLAANPGCELMYVSCEVTSLARDLVDLTRAGGPRLRQLEAYDMFPFTEKMEWLAILK